MSDIDTKMIHDAQEEAKRRGEANWHPEIPPGRVVDDGIPGWLALIIIGGFLGIAAGFVYAIVVGR